MHLLHGGPYSIGTLKMDEKLRLLLVQVVFVIWLFMVGSSFAEMLNELFYGSTGNVIVRMIASLVLICLLSGAIWIAEYMGKINFVLGSALAVAGGALWTVYAVRTNQIF